MKDYKKLKIPTKERLEVQILDDTESGEIKNIITSVSTISVDRVTKQYRLYSVSQDGSIKLICKGADPSKFSLN